jgi:hypothetical protein
VRPAAVVLGIGVRIVKFRPVPLDTRHLTPVFLVETNCPPDVAARATTTFIPNVNLLIPFMEAVPWGPYSHHLAKSGLCDLVLARRGLMSAS